MPSARPSRSCAIKQQHKILESPCDPRFTARPRVATLLGAPPKRPITAARNSPQIVVNLSGQVAGGEAQQVTLSEHGLLCESHELYEQIHNSLGTLVSTQLSDVV